MRREPLRRRSREHPERGLGDRIGCKFRRELAHTLVDHVDDAGAGDRLARRVARRPRRLRGEGLREFERRAQVRADVPVPAFPGRAGDRVMLEDRGVVDEHGQWPAERRLLVCAERAEEQELAAALHSLPAGPMALLVGPEGGFTDDELARLARYPFVTFVKLGPRILRAETASFAALSIWQAVKGDWQQG